MTIIFFRWVEPPTTYLVPLLKGWGKIYAYFIGFTGLPNIVALNHWQVGEKNPQFALISKIILSIYNVMKLSLRRCFFAPKNQPKIMISKSKMSIFESCFPCLASSFRQKLSSRCTCKNLEWWTWRCQLWFFIYFGQLGGLKGKWDPLFQGKSQIGGNSTPPKLSGWNLKMMGFQVRNLRISRDFFSGSMLNFRAVFSFG